MDYPFLLSQPDWQLLRLVSGSQAYGTALPGSDRDTKGVFVLPRAVFYGLSYPEQVADAGNDHVFYELHRWVELLAKNNPNVLEMLASPADCVLHRHPLAERFTPTLFLSRLCRDTFAGYARTQIRKARGLNKKIVNPMPEARKDVLDFCYIAVGAGSRPVLDWLATRGWRPEDCGLAKLPHFRDGYALFHDPTGNHGYQGIIRSEQANDVCLSTIPKGEVPSAVMSFNKDGYQAYCKDYRHYWDWVEQRNEARYRDTMAHRQGYDTKNMLHVFRLLGMAEDIARRGEIIVRRPEADHLLAIRRGEFSYDHLLREAEQRLARIERLFDESPLPEQPDPDRINRVLVEVREAWYGNGF